MFYLLVGALALLFYIYQGYYWVLLGLRGFRKVPSAMPLVQLPSVTLLITVYNEAARIEAKLANALALDYPPELLQILVASDGSTDETEALVRAYTDPRVTLFVPDQPIGKTDTQNKAIGQARGEILAFTDAETMFRADYLRELVQPFADPKVGGVCAQLHFLREGGGISQSQGFYWNYELKLRQLESELSLLAVASGACMAIRRELFQPMTAAYGEDCIVPLAVVGQGYVFRHVARAQATDRMATSESGEFRTRVRMTLRNWQGTWAYPKLLNPLRHPGYAFALWSHKILRWCSPLFLGLATLSAFFLAPSSLPAALVALGFVGFYLLAALGWWAEHGGPSLPLVHTAYSFLLANLGFLVGVWRAMTGHQVTKYHTPVAP